MNKIEFLEKLEQKLKGLPKENVHERLNFYSEMIDDLTEEGMSEEEAVENMGNVDEIATNIITDLQVVSPEHKTEQKNKPKLTAGMIVFIVLCSPIWFPLLISAVVVVFSLYISLWLVLISLWAVFGSLVACAFAGIIASFAFIFGGHTFSSIALIGASLVCAGMSILFFFGCKASTDGTILLTKTIAKAIKNIFSKKEAV